MHLSTVPARFVRVVLAQTPPRAVWWMRWARSHNPSYGTPGPTLFPPVTRVRLHQVCYGAGLYARQLAVGNHQLPFGHRGDEISDQTYPFFPRASVLHLLLLAHREDAQSCAIFVFASLHVGTEEVSYYLALAMLLDFERAIVDDVEPRQLLQDVHLIPQDGWDLDQPIVIDAVGERNAVGVRVYEPRCKGAQLLALLVRAGIGLDDRTGAHDTTERLFHLAGFLRQFRCCVLGEPIYLMVVPVPRYTQAM